MKQKSVVYGSFAKVCANSSSWCGRYGEGANKEQYLARNLLYLALQIVLNLKVKFFSKLQQFLWTI